MQEEWKQIPGYSSYKVSNLGNLLSYKTGEPKPLKQSICSKYKMVTLTEGSNRQTTHVHKLVAIAFLGYEPNGYEQTINHIDADKLNNRLDNLEIISHRENSNLAQMNRKKSKLRGVSIVISKKGEYYYRATIQHLGVNYYIGSTKCEQTAGEMYNKALYIVLNEPHRIQPGTKFRDLL